MVFKKVLLISTAILLSSCGLSELRIKSLDKIEPVKTNKIKVNWSVSKIKLTRALTDAELVNKNNKLFLIGGDTGFNWISNNNSYDFLTDKWELKAALKTRRSGHIAEVVDNNIIVAGGFDGNGWLENTENYSLEINKFKQGSPMFTKRSGVGSICYKTKKVLCCWR